MPVQDRAQRRAHRDVRHRRRARAGAALHAALRGHPGRRHARHVGPRRHLSAGPRRGAGRDARARDRADVRADRASRRSPVWIAAMQLLVLGARRGEPAAPGESRPRPRRRRRAGKGPASVGAGRDDADPRCPRSRVADPNEVLRPVNPGFVAAHAGRWRCCSTCCPLIGTALDAAPGLPRARAPVLVHPGAALRRRRHRLVHGAADGRRRRHGLRPARARLRVPRLCRRVLPPPRAALSRSGSRRCRSALLLLLCAALVLLVRVVGGAPLPAVDVFRLRARRARCCGRSLSVLLQMPQRPVRSSAL